MSVESNLEGYIVKGKSWDDLPQHVKNQLGNSQQVYNNEVKTYCLTRCTAYESSLARIFMTKHDYYSEMLSFMRANLRVFPYQFSEFVINELKMSPFSYYFDMLCDIMKAEKSYDILPNFTAADVNRLMGIGRNQYIDIMNKVRSKKWMWKLNKGIVRELLPQYPNKIPIDYWWIVEAFPLPQAEFVKIFNTLNEDEQFAIGTVKKEGKVLACKLPYHSLVSIYRRGLVHLHVPVENPDYIIVPPLQGFIMNRTTNDYFEKILYEVLVTIDERTNVAELANILERDTELVKTAVSICCRLGFAKKRVTRPKNLDENSEDQYHNSWESEIEAYHNQINAIAVTTLGKKEKRIGFLFDSSLTAYLMMGNLAEGLKKHAVTLFEVGKMSDEMLDDFLSELDTIKSCGDGVGDAKRYYLHAISLRTTLRFLRHNDAFNIPNCDNAVDLIRCESLNNLEPPTRLRILDANYSVLITVAPLASGTLSLPACIPRFYGPPISEVTSPWFKIYTYTCAGVGAPSALLVKGQRLRKLPKFLKNCERVMLAGWEQEPNSMGTAILLQVLNESLMSNPMFIQVYEVDSSRPTRTFDVSFPFDPTLLETAEEKKKNEDSNNSNEDSENETSKQDGNSQSPSLSPPNDEDDEDDEKPMVHTEKEKQQVKIIMENLTNKLHLECSFGIVKMMKVYGMSEEKDEGTIFPVELFFGIPLGDAKMNESVCDLIVKKKLFTQENLEKHSTNMKQLCAEFLGFIDANTDKVTRSKEENSIFYPTSNLYFDGSSISNSIQFQSQ